MGFRTNLESVIPAKTRQRGSAIVRAGRVMGMRHAPENTVAARVLGTHRYRTSMSLDEDGQLFGHCTCAAFAKWGPCKHLWALALAADDAQIVLVPGSLLRIKEDLDDGFDAYDSLVDDFTDDWRDPVGARFGRRREAKPDWERRVQSLHLEGNGAIDPFGHVSARAERLLYTIDVEESRRLGRTVFEVWHQRELLRGGWSVPKNLTPESDQAWRTADETDRAALASMAPPPTQRSSSWGSPWRSGGYAPPPVRDPARYLPVLVPALVRTGRFFERAPEENGPVGDPLVLDEGPPWTFGVRLGAGPQREEVALAGYVERAGQRLALDDLRLVFGAFFLHQGVVARLDARGGTDLLMGLRRAGAIVAPAAARASLLALAVGNAGEAALEIEGLETTSVVPVPHLAIRGPGEDVRKPTVLDCRLAFTYGDLQMDAAEPALYLHVGGEGQLLRRDRDAERAAVLAFLDAGGLPPRPGGHLGVARVKVKDLPAVVGALLEQGWTIEADGVPYRQSGAFSLSVSSGIDWFDLEGELDFGGATASLPDLLQAARSGSRTVTLGDGSVGILPERWLEGWELADALGQVEGEGLRFGMHQAWVLDALLAARDGVEVDEQFQSYRERLQGFDGIKPARTPRSLRATLRDYQKEGLAWLRFLQTMGIGGCLADDMGLGKTVQVLALLAGRKADRTKHPPSIVVAPRSLIFHWREEAARFAPSLRVLTLTGPGRKQHLPELDRYDLIVTTYGTLRRDILELKDVNFDYAILDEAQAIKNAASQSAKAARLLRADHRLALSGTPIENHLGELWSLFEFLNPGMLGKAKAFRDLVGGKNGQDLDEAGRERLAKAVRPFVLRRTKEEVLDDLPEKTEQILHCEMDARQGRDYRRIRDHVRATLASKEAKATPGQMKIHVLEALLRLRQAACHVGLLDETRKDESSAKLDVLLSNLEEILEGDHKVLVFSQFTKLLAIVRDRLDAQGVVYEYLDGRTRKRQEKVKRFQEDPDCRVFLISLKAGGLGLNLTAADYVFVLDPWWNPAVERQAVDRAHRIGQKKPVIAYRLICQDTVEEKVLELQAEKRELAEAVLGGGRSVLKDLTREDLEALFG